MTTTTARPATVADLIRCGVCRGGCLAGITTAGRCTCPCRGRHHGLLADVQVDQLRAAR